MTPLFGQNDPFRDRGTAHATPTVATAATQAADQALFHLDLGRSLFLYRWVVVACIIAGLAVAAMQVRSLWPVYIAQSQVYVQPAPARILPQGYNARWPFDTASYDSFMQQQLQAPQHQDVLMLALRKLGPAGWQKHGEPDSAAAARIGAAVTVERPGNGYQLNITAKAKDPVVAARLANAMAEALVEIDSREERGGEQVRLEMLRDERDRIQKSMDADHAEQQELNSKLGVAGVTGVPDAFDEDNSRMRQQLVEARTAHDEAAARLAATVEGQGASPQTLESAADEIVSSDAGLAAMKNQLDARRAQLVSQMANLTPSHPTYKQDAAELAQIDNSINQRMKQLRAQAAVRIEQKLRADLERTSAVEAKLNAAIGARAAQAGSVTARMQRATDLAADLQRLQTRFNTVDEHLHDLELEANAPSIAALSAQATPPGAPTLAPVIRKALPLGASGIFLGVLLALLLNKLDRRVYIAADLEHLLGFAPMSQLPLFDEVSDGARHECMMRLASNIEHIRQQGNLRRFQFTAVGMGAGTTTVVSQVRAMLDAMGRPSVLLDSAVAQPGAFEEPNQPGLVLAERGSRSTALLQQLQEETREDESLLFADSAPLPVSAETELLARYVDAVIVVVESGVTTRQQLRAVAQTLQRLDVAAVGFVLNKIPLAKADASFRHGIRDLERHLDQQRPGRNRTPQQHDWTVPVSATPEAAPMPAPRPMPVPLAEPMNEDVAEFVPEPQAEPVTEPVLQPVLESVTEPVREPVAATNPEPSPVSDPNPAPTIALDWDTPPDHFIPHIPPPTVERVAEPVPARAVIEPEMIQASIREAVRESVQQAVQQAVQGVVKDAVQDAVHEVAQRPAVAPPVSVSAAPISSAAVAAEPIPVRVAEPVAEQEVAVAAPVVTAPTEPELLIPRTEPKPPAPPVAARVVEHAAEPVAARQDPLPLMPAEPAANLPRGRALVPVEPQQRDHSRFTELLAKLSAALHGAPPPSMPKIGAAATEPTSRIGGLRGEDFAANLRNLQRVPDPPPAEAPAAAAERANFARNFSAARPEPRVDIKPQVVVAKPEFLPPRQASDESTERKKPNLRRDRRDAADDLDTLPSWRGQYRKK